MFDATAERRFLLLKKKLDSLHYCQPLSLDSAALVERLLGDLVRTTEGFQSLKKANDEIKQEALLKTNGLLPLQKENVRLTKENNDLHLELIRTKETCESQESRWKSSLKVLEGEKNDMKFIVQQKGSSVQRLEEENQGLKQKLDVILGKAYTTKLKGLKDRDFEQENLKNSINSLNKRDSQALEAWSDKRIEDLKVWAEKLREADQRVLELESALKNSGLERQVFEERIRFLEQAVQGREKEIKRLHGRLELSSPSDRLEKVAAGFEHEQMGEKVKRLEHQLDLLSKENQSLGVENKNMKRDYARTELIKQELLGKIRENDELRRVNGEVHAKAENELKLYEKEAEKARIEAKIMNDRVNELELQGEELMRKCENMRELCEAEKQEKLAFLESAKASNQLNSAYNSDKRAFVSKLEALEHENKSLEALIQEKEKERSRLEGQLGDIDRTLAVGRSENLSLKRENEALKAELEEKNRIYEELDGTVKRLQEELVQRTHQFEESTAFLQENKANLARIEARTKHFEAENSRIKSDFQRIQANRDSADSQKQKLESLYDSALREVEFLKGESKFFEEKENSYLRDIFIEKEAVNASKMELLAVKEKLRLAEGENNRLKEKAEYYQTTIRSLEARRLEQEKDLVNLKVLMESQGSFERKLQTLGEENERLNGEVRDHRRAFELQSVDFTQLQAACAQKDRIIAELRQEGDRLQSQAVLLRDDNEGLMQAHRRVFEKNQDLESLKVLVESFREKLVGSGEEKQQLLHELGGLQEKNEQNFNEKNRLEKKCQELQEEIIITQNQLRELKNIELNTSNVSARMLEKTRGYELLIEDLKGSNRQLLQKTEGLQRELETVVSKCRTGDLKVRELEEANGHLETLVKGLEKSKEELFERLRANHMDKSRENEELERVFEEKRIALAEKNRLEGEIKGLKGNILQIDQERDEMQGVLDLKTEENAELVNRLRNLEAEHMQLRRETQGQLVQKEGFVRSVGELENQLRELKRKLQSASEENQEFKRLVATRQQENSEMAEDLRLLSREHAKMNEEMALLVNDRDFLAQELKRLSQANSDQEQAYRGLEIERDDLLGLYKESAGENEGLKHNLDDVVQDNKELFEKLRTMEREARMFEEERVALQRKEAALQGELRTLQRNLATVTAKAEKLEGVIQRFEFENRSLKGELNGFQESLSGENLEKIEAKKEIMQLENEKNQCLALNERLEMEIANRAGSLREMERDLRELELVLERERKGRFDLEGELQHMGGELQVLREENAKLRMGSFRESSGREKWGRSLNEVAIGTEGLKEKARKLQNDYEEILRKEG